MPVTVTVWIVVGAKKLTLQRLWLLLAGTLASAHDELFENEPAVEVQETLPVGFVGLPLAVSDTVAVQVVEPPTVAETGKQLTLVVVLRVTENVCAFEVPPPGAELKTVIGKVPVVVRSPDGIVALSCVELTKVVVLSTPLKRTVDTPETKPVPLTVKAKVPLFWGLLVGEMLVVVGIGLVVSVKLIAVPENVLPALSVAVACTA